MNNKGFSWAETILTLFITFMIATILLPLLTNMNVKLEDKKRKYHSAIVMNEAAKLFVTENIKNGSLTIESVTFNFQIDEQQVCVEYPGVRGEVINCIEISSVN